MKDFIGLCLHVFANSLPNRIARDAKNACRKQTRVLSTGASNGERSNRNATWHLNDRQKRIESVQRAASYGDTQNGKRSHRRDHARQMSSASRSGDDDSVSLSLGRLREFDHPLRRSMRGDNHAVGIDAKLTKDISS